MKSEVMLFCPLSMLWGGTNPVQGTMRVIIDVMLRFEVLPPTNTQPCMREFIMLMFMVTLSNSPCLRLGRVLLLMGGTGQLEPFIKNPSQRLPEPPNAKGNVLNALATMTV